MDKPNTVTKAYNLDWQKKALDAGRTTFQRRVVDTLSNLFDGILGISFKGRILDLGCGDGSVVEAMNQYEGVAAEGIDIGHSVDFETDRLPYVDASFDIVLMYSVIEHLHNPGNALTEVRRILKKNGHVIVITPNFDLRNFLVCDRTFYEDPTHVHPYNPVSLPHVMRIYGLEKAFLGLWTVKKPISLWKKPELLQFFIGAFLPFRGNHPWAPSFLKGSSRTILSVFKKTE